MNELKAMTVIDAYQLECNDNDLVYLKSEVDAVLAEKDTEIAELKSDIVDLRDDKKLTDTILDERNTEIAELNDKLRHYPMMTALIERGNKEIAELKDKCQMHDFFWEGCGFKKRRYKNSIAVSEAFDKLEAENTELKAKVDMLLSCLKCLVMRDLIKDCSEKASAIEIVKEYDK